VAGKAVVKAREVTLANDFEIQAPLRSRKAKD
jgi:hypothetical protein